MITVPPRVTYGPGYGPRSEWENLVLLEVLQASQGLIGAHVRGVAVEAGYGLIVVHVCVDGADADTMEDLSELVSDMEISMEQYVEPLPTVELRLHVGDTDGSWPGHLHRRLYLMHWRARESYVPE